MSEVNLIFPHQLFKESPLIKNGHSCYLVEEYLFFKQYPFHKQKIAFHRASMQFYKDYLSSKKRSVTYIDAQDKQSDIRKLIPALAREKIKVIHYLDPTDDWLNKRIQAQAQKADIECKVYDSQLFLNNDDDLKSFFKSGKKKFFQTKFYISERKKRGILLEKGQNPQGGKWSYDSDNREKYPKDKTPPKVSFPDADKYFKEATTYVEKHFDDHLGELTEKPLYPTSYEAAEEWLDQFLKVRFKEFGPYEDAIVPKESILNHSVLTPMLNVGLLTPQQILDASLKYAQKHDIPLNSTEGFVRQIIGWREFIRGIYGCKGVEERTKNFWGFERKIPKSFYDGTTGIVPVDITIKKVLRSGYCHHIERLMVLGNFMLLCEFHPDAVYQWFMELFIDAYDWVMVPNVYGMSQFADGGLMATKPYISSSNYLMKMSHYEKGDWQQIWDGLFWRFMHVNRDFFTQNPRLGMLIGTFDKMAEEKREKHLKTAEDYLDSLK